MHPTGKGGGYGEGRRRWPPTGLVANVCRTLRPDGIGTPLPPGLIAVAKFLAGLRYDARWGDLDYPDQPEVYDIPVLVFHGMEDDMVPIGTSEELKRLVPAVRLVRCASAGHNQCWNVDPQAYETQVTTFLDQAIA